MARMSRGTKGALLATLALLLVGGAWWSVRRAPGERLERDVRVGNDAGVAESALTAPPTLDEPADALARVQGSTSGETREIELELASPPKETVTGFVLDVQGGGIEGAEVWATDPSFALARNSPCSSIVKSARDGRFRLMLEGEGRRLLHASAPRFNGAVHDLLLPDEARQEPCLVLVRLARVSGRVLAPDGAPCPHADVSAGEDGPYPYVPNQVWAFSEPVLVESLRDSHAVEADAEGRFTIDPEAGDVRLRAWAQDLAPSEGQLFELGPGEALDDIQLQLRPGCRLRGRVRNDDGQAVNAWVLLLAPDGTRVQVESERGCFALANLPAGTWTISPLDGYTGTQNVQLEPARETEAVLDWVHRR